MINSHQYLWEEKTLLNVLTMEINLTSLSEKNPNPREKMESSRAVTLENRLTEIWIGYLVQMTFQINLGFFLLLTPKVVLSVYFFLSNWYFI